MMRIETLPLGLGLMMGLAGCPGDDTGTTTAAGPTTTGEVTTSDSSGDDTTGDDTTSMADSTTSTTPPMCLGVGGAGAVGDACTANGDCESGVCTIFTDAPVNDDATCAESAADCSTRVTGTVFDFMTGEPVAGATVTVAPALQAATNPTGAMALVSATSDADGRIDAVSAGPIMAPLGIVALSSATDYYLTATGVAGPAEGMSYAVGNSVHDLWVVPNEALGDWSDALEGDAEIPPENLPLGENGGVVGFVRSADGLPLAGAQVAGADDSSAFIRYLADDGSFGTDSTSDLGIFVILNPGLGEDFTVSAGGAEIGQGTAGSTGGAIFTLIVTGS